MNKDFFKHHLQIIAKNALGMQQNITRLSILENEILSIRQGVTAQSNAINIAVSTAIGLFESDNVKTDDIFSNYLKISPPEFVSSGFDSQTILEELKKMIIELNIKGSIRTRENGLIELRSKDFGSIYGRTKAEIEQKLTNKLKEAKQEKNN